MEKPETLLELAEKTSKSSRNCRKRLIGELGTPRAERRKRMGMLPKDQKVVRGREKKKNGRGK